MFQDAIVCALAIERSFAFGSLTHSRRQDFDGDDAIEARVAGLQTSPMPPAPMALAIP
jgi:hypothetical protein